METVQKNSYFCRKKMRKIFFLLLSLLMIMAACGPDKKTDKDSPPDSLNGKLRIAGSETMFPLFSQWAQEFNRENPDFHIIIKASNTAGGMMMLKKGEADAVMASRELSPEEVADSLWTIPVAMDVVLPVFSFDNPYIQKIVQQGIKPEKLKDIYTQKIKTWGQLFNTDSDDPIELYRLADTSGTTACWSSLLNIQADQIKGMEVFGNTDMSNIIPPKKLAFGYCSSSRIFNPATGKKIKNIYVAPIDFNNNGQTDDAEQLFDDYADLKTAIKNSKYPAPPARQLYLVFKRKPTDKAVLAFLKWTVTIGQNYCDQFGFIHLNTEKAKEILTDLQ